MLAVGRLRRVCLFPPGLLPGARAGLLALVAIHAGLLYAAQAPESRDAPPLPAVLSRLQQNYQEYLRSVPNLFCDERVKSALAPAGSFRNPVQSLTDSTFRLQRALGPDRKVTLKESRDVRKVDGKPVETTSLAGPSVLSGVFGWALGLVSSAEAGCFRYKEHPHLAGRAGSRRIVVEFKTLPARERAPDCGTRESEGRAQIDPETMHIRRIEMRTPDYQILPEVPGDWRWSADYDVVELSGKPFWLPKNIQSEAVAYGPHGSVWTFEAQYSGYHQLSVRTRILPGTTVEPPPEAVPGHDPAPPPGAR